MIAISIHNPIFGNKSNMPVFGEKSNNPLYGAGYLDIYLEPKDLADEWRSTAIYTRSDGEQYGGEEWVDSYGSLWAHGNATRVGSRYDKIEISFKDHIAYVPLATEATLYAKVRAIRDVTSSDDGFSKDIVYPIECIIHDGYISIPSGAFEEITQKACAEVGATYTTGPSYLISGGGGVYMTGKSLLRIKIR